MYPFGLISCCRVLVFLNSNPFMFIFVMLIECYTKIELTAMGRGGRGGGGGRGRTSNDDRSDSKNPNNPAYWASVANRADQLNPDHDAYWSSRSDDKPQRDEKDQPEK